LVPGALFWFAPFQRVRHAKPWPKGWGFCSIEYGSHRRNCYLQHSEWRVARGDHDMMTFLDSSNEEILLTHEVSDEALEAAGGNEVVGNYTLAACTGLSVCPG
jgi:hypothetical protein